MSATDVLRRVLDERGVEYFKHEDGEPLRKLEKADEPATSWHMGGASVCAVPIEGSDLFDLWIDHCTPAQAIATTLGRGTCQQEEHGWSTEGDHARVWLTCGHDCMVETVADLPNYCPICGAEVMHA